jgi:hypothetical protein
VGSCYKASRRNKAQLTNAACRKPSITPVATTLMQNPWPVERRREKGKTSTSEYYIHCTWEHPAVVSLPSLWPVPVNEAVLTPSELKSRDFLQCYCDLLHLAGLSISNRVPSSIGETLVLGCC